MRYNEHSYFAHGSSNWTTDLKNNLVISIANVGMPTQIDSNYWSSYTHKRKYAHIHKKTFVKGIIKAYHVMIKRGIKLPKCQ